MKLANKWIQTSMIRISKHNWELPVTEEDIGDLAKNIEEVGNLHPIIVRPIGKAGTRYEVLAGRRRYMAQKALGRDKIEVRVVKCDDIRAEIISYSENLKVRKPDSRAWSAGVKRLVDLFEKESEKVTKKQDKPKQKQKDKSTFGTPRPKSPLGRPKAQKHRPSRT